MGTQTTQTNAPQSPADRAGTVGHETKQATQDVAATAGHEARRVTREAKDQVQQLWGQTRSELTDQAATQQGRAASGLRELAGQLGQMADSADQDGVARGLVDDVARRAHEAASWLDQRDPGSLLEEVRTYARRRPGAFLAIAAGVGLVAGRMSRSLVEEARDADDPSTGTASLGGTGHGAGGTAYESGTTGYGVRHHGLRLRHHGLRLRHHGLRLRGHRARVRQRRRLRRGQPGGHGHRGHRHPHRDEPDERHDRVHAGDGGLHPQRGVRGHGDDSVGRPARAAPHHAAGGPRRHAVADRL